MRTPDVPEPQEDKSAKEKKQLLILGGLVVVLAVGMVLQFGSGDEQAEASTSAIAVDEAALAEARAEVAAEQGTGLAGNSVLSQSSDADALNDGVFKSFWNTATPVEAEIVEVPPPTITINATLCAVEGTESGGTSLAVIDGGLRRVGDVIGGWSLESIRQREVTLRSATNRLVTVAMPLLDPTRAPSMGSGAWSRGSPAASTDGVVTAQGEAANFTADAIAEALGGMLQGGLDESLVETLTNSMSGGVADGAIDIAGALQSLQMDPEALDGLTAEELLPVLAGQGDAPQDND